VWVQVSHVRPDARSVLTWNLFFLYRMCPEYKGKPQGKPATVLKNVALCLLNVGKAFR
jgi:hypothetical protein